MFYQSSVNSAVESLLLGHLYICLSLGIAFSSHNMPSSSTTNHLEHMNRSMPWPMLESLRMPSWCQKQPASHVLVRDRFQPTICWASDVRCTNLLLVSHDLESLKVSQVSPPLLLYPLLGPRRVLPLRVDLVLLPQLGNGTSTSGFWQSRNDNVCEGNSRESDGCSGACSSFGL